MHKLLDEAPLAAPARSGLRRIVHVLGEEVANLNLRLLIAQLAVAFLPGLCFSRVRTLIYRHVAGFEIGKGSMIFGRLDFSETRYAQQRLHIGRLVNINKHFFVDLTSDITIGDNVSIGHHVVFITANHEIGPPSARCGENQPRPIHIGPGSWIGAHSTVLPGVTVGESSVVAAGSIVSMNVPPNKVVGGVPARPIKSLSM